MPSLRSLAIGFLLLAGALGGDASATAQPRPVRVGIVLDGDWHRNDAVLALIRTEILDLTRGEFDIRFPEDKRITADWTTAGVEAALDRLLADPRVDVVLASGVLASHIACGKGPFAKPVLAPFVIDAGIQGLPEKNGASGVKNLSYLSLPRTFDRDLGVFLEIADFDRLVILVQDVVARTMAGIEPNLVAAARARGVEPTIIQVGTSVGPALEAFPPDAQAVYVGPLLRLSDSAFDSLVAGLIRRKLPSFSLLGESEVQRGILAGLNPDIFPRIARRLALNLQSILLGEDPGSLPTAFPAGERLTVNMETARRIGRYPPWAMLTEAVQVGERRTPPDASWTLESATRYALTANRDLIAFDRAVAAGRQDVNLARSALLPRIDLEARGLAIDEDRAAAGFGTTAERSLSGTARLSQVLFSDPALAELSIQGRLQTSREEERRRLRLDVALQASTAYFTVLRALTAERIQRENVALNRANLELARVRLSVGFSGRSDVLRWESEIARNRKRAIEAVSRRNAAEIAFNRVLHRPLEESFELEDVSAGSQGILDAYPYLSYFREKASFETLRAFLAREAVFLSPEIASLDAGIEAASRRLSAARRSFTLPRLALQGEVTRRFSKGGVGSDPPALDFFDLPDDTDWSLALVLQYPLFAGTSRYAEKRRASEELYELRIRREALAERIEERVRTALHLAGGAYAGIEQARLSAEAAGENLDLVTDAYSQGTVSILDLLDAQNAYIVASEDADNALYDFLADLMEVQRAVGRFDFLLSAEEREAFRQRLESAFAPGR